MQMFGNIQSLQKSEEIWRFKYYSCQLFAENFGKIYENYKCIYQLI